MVSSLPPLVNVWFPRLQFKAQRRYTCSTLVFTLHTTTMWQAQESAVFSMLGLHTSARVGGRQRSSIQCQACSPDMRPRGGHNGAAIYLFYPRLLHLACGPMAHEPCHLSIQSQACSPRSQLHPRPPPRPHRPPLRPRRCSGAARGQLPALTTPARFCQTR